MLAKILGGSKKLIRLVYWKIENAIFQQNFKKSWKLLLVGTELGVFVGLLAQQKTVIAQKIPIAISKKEIIPCKEPGREYVLISDQKFKNIFFFQRIV